jgi:putative ABC transport system substrate-binding protein
MPLMSCSLETLFIHAVAEKERQVTLKGLIMAARKIGFLHTGTKASFQEHYAAFVHRLDDFVGPDEIEIVERWAGDDTSKSLEQHAKALANEKVDVLVSAGGPPAAKAAKKATAHNKVPVVFTSVTDPVGLGLVKNLDNPRGNLTGIAGMTSELDVPRLEILCELLGARKKLTIGVLNNANRPGLEGQFKKLETAARELGAKLVRLDVADLAGIQSAFASIKKAKPVDAILITADSLFNNLRHDVVKFPGAIPAIYQWREFAEIGGLMSFGSNIIDAYEQAAEYVSHILDGDAPSDLPVSLPDRYELVINLRVAHKNDITIPASLLCHAEFVRNRLRKRRAPGPGSSPRNARRHR